VTRNLHEQTRRTWRHCFEIEKYSGLPPGLESDETGIARFPRLPAPAIPTVSNCMRLDLEMNRGC
jgi:hypothetical protein